MNLKEKIMKPNLAYLVVPFGAVTGDWTCHRLIHEEKKAISAEIIDFQKHRI